MMLLIGTIADADTGLLSLSVTGKVRVAVDRVGGSMALRCGEVAKRWISNRTSSEVF
jgi:hypothetical protein